jgi:hypothetical protein
MVPETPPSCENHVWTGDWDQLGSDSDQLTQLSSFASGIGRSLVAAGRGAANATLGIAFQFFNFFNHLNFGLPLDAPGPGYNWRDRLSRAASDEHSWKRCKLRSRCGSEDDSIEG